LRENDAKQYCQSAAELTKVPEEFRSSYVLHQVTLPMVSYHTEPIGVIEEDAYANLSLFNGIPLEDISILTTPDETLGLGRMERFRRTCCAASSGIGRDQP
jgi:hypothetical protein